MVQLPCLSRLLLRRKFLSRSVVSYQKINAAQNDIKIQTSFKFSELGIQFASPNQLQPKPDVSSLQFGKHFTDHMLKILYYETLGGWQKPQITPLQNIALHPGAKVLHYALELFEGMKAYRGADGKIRMFRPDLNMARMNSSAVRLGLPTFDGNEFIKCLCRLLSIDQEWVPHSEASSLYIRPTLIGIDPALGVAAGNSAMLYVILCPVGSYFDGGVKAVSLLADPQYVRAWPGGCGDKKLGSNYGPTVYVQREASEQGLQQVLWLYGEEHFLTEIGTMNIFFFFINNDGEKELITPPLDGLILPGITRRSILEITKAWNEFKITERHVPMKEVIQLLQENRVLEIFGAGTACVVTPIGMIKYLDKTLNIPTIEWTKEPLFDRVLRTLTDIQYGRVPHPWAISIDEYC